MDWEYPDVRCFQSWLEKEIFFVTRMKENVCYVFGFGAMKIASIYKDRWEIKLFFKALKLKLKQSLKVKTFRDE